MELLDSRQQLLHRHAARNRGHREVMPSMRMRPILIGTIVLAAAAMLASAPAIAQGPAPAASAAGRLTDNGNETITDSQTGLIWEKKTTAVGSGENLRDPRDVDNT